MESPYLYLNGQILPVDRAGISPFDIGLLRGYAVFDLLRTAGGRPFLLGEHLARLHASAQQLGLAVPASDDAIVAAIDQLLELNGHEEATVRLVLTGGVSPDGMSFHPDTPTFMIMTHELHEPAAELYEQGGVLLTQQHRRELPTAKTTGYLTMLHNRGRLRNAGAMDLLYCDGDRVLEAASASVYVVSDNVVRAPARDVLLGTVGTLMLALAGTDYATRLEPVSLTELFSADEVLLTSTTRGVVPIVRIDDRVIGDGVPGPAARELNRRYRELLSSSAQG